VKTLGEKFVLNSEDCPPNVDEGGVSAPNHTLSLVNPLMIITLFFVFGNLFPFCGEPYH
jgi:hypothetical protein